MKTPLRRYRWHLVSALGLVILLWVGPYWYWRREHSMAIVSHRVIFVPDWVPEGWEKAFQPLAEIDGCLTGEPVILNRWDIAFPKDMKEGLRETIDGIGKVIDQVLPPENR